jgi:hypothetical protein
MAKMTRQQMYEARLRQDGDEVSVLCNHCQQWQSGDGFHKSGGRFKSMCKKCHREKYGGSSGYVAPSVAAAKKEAAEKREKFLSEIVTCVNCGEGKPRRDYYIKKERRYSDRCCGPRRSADQIERDLADGMKDCTTCGLRLPLDDFQQGGSGRDGLRGSCKCCEAAKVKVGADDLIAASKLLRETHVCDYCGVRMGHHYPIRSSNKTIEYLHPLSRGGEGTMSNIAVMCLGCTTAKGNRTMAEFARVKKKAVRQ